MLGIIGGSGFYNMARLSHISEKTIKTPYGLPSAALTIAKYDSTDIVFLPRHGNHHNLLPSEINYRANIWALKYSGVKQIISVSAVGSLQPTILPGDFVLPSQYMDYTKGIRTPTFFGNGLVAHVSTAQSVCPALSNTLANTAHTLGHTIHRDKTYICVEGPRLGSCAESLLFKNVFQADVIGMTNIPEVFLAREAQINYTSLGIVTDFDCWLDHPSKHVTVKDVISTFMKNVTIAKEIVEHSISQLPPIDEDYRQTLDAAILTPPEQQNDTHRELLAVLKK